MKIALQMHSLRDVKDDFATQLRKVAGIGYAGVEFAGFHGMSKAELGKLLSDRTLEAAAAHIGYDQLKDNLAKTLDFCAGLGIKYAALPHYGFTCADDYKRIGGFLSDCALASAKYGIQMMFHNHAAEIETVYGGKRGIDYLLEDRDVMFQPDIYWIQYAGCEPREFLKAYAGRCPVVHVKDMTGDGTRKSVPVGTGVVDVAGVLKLCPALGTKWLTVEDESEGEPWENVTVSYAILEKLLQKK